MPPRPAVAAAALRIFVRPHTSTTAAATTCLLAPTYLVPLRHTIQRQHQQRNASILSSLADNPGAYHKRIRKGRGPASGKGKTAGRGQKGQHAHGKVPRGFQGGQTPLSITKPERGRGVYNP
jgi:large subunit ribosomal protein L15